MIANIIIVYFLLNIVGALCEVIWARKAVIDGAKDAIDSSEPETEKERRNLTIFVVVFTIVGCLVAWAPLRIISKE